MSLEVTSYALAWKLQLRVSAGVIAFTKRRDVLNMDVFVLGPCISDLFRHFPHFGTKVLLRAKERNPLGLYMRLVLFLGT